MKVFLVLLLAATLTLISNQSALAEPDSKYRRDLAEKYAVLIELEQTIDTNLDIMITLSGPSMQANIPEFSSEEGEEVRREIKNNYKRIILDKIISEYAEMYSASELLAFINFSESSEGCSIWSKRKLRSEIDGNAFSVAYDYEDDFKTAVCKKLKCKTK